MRWKQGAGASRCESKSGPEQAPGRLDDLMQAAGELEIAERIRREPPEIVEFLVQRRLARSPARGERHKHINAAAAGPRNNLAPSGEADDVDLERGFLVDFAMHGCVQRFAEFY